MKIRLFFVFALMLGSLCAQTASREKFNLGPWEKDIGYAQAVRVGQTVYVSGTVGEGAMPDAIKQAYEGIARSLAAFHLTLADVVKENIYTTQIDELIKHKAVRNALYGSEFPAATWVQVSRLYDPAHVIEVEVIAVIPDAKPAAPAKQEKRSE